jgi:CheY-like chemotaxis protein
LDTVLIVDDSSFIVEGLIAFLKKKYRPIAAYGGAECLEILKRETPSVIILDIMMEPMDGWETLTRIKENEKTRRIPVLMFSAKKISPEEAEQHRVSIDDFITKPVSPKKITDAIEKVLTRRDTNRVIVERWQSAGISQDKIDEYLSLTTSLEVDLSLCQNMRIQYDLVHPADKNQEEFHAVIKAIEERIVQERDLIEKLAREMNDTLERGIDGGDPAGMVDRPLPGEPAGRNRTGGTGSGSLLPFSPYGEGSETAAAGPGVTAGENPGGMDPEHPAPPVAGDLSFPLPPPDEDIPGTDRRPELPVPGISPGDFPGRSPPAPTEISRPDAAVIETASPVLPPGGPESVPEKDAGPDGSARETTPGVVSLSPPSLIPPAHDPPVTEARKVIPADPDSVPAGSRASALTGSGTDVPMPWDNLRDRKTQLRVPLPSEKKESSKAGSVSPSPGIFARIISLVQSLFSKRK